ncbi:ThuA domain-containing protein [Paenibacillus sp. TRM 82003]|nr:ThuA domain-containing protein [Paenibacillus sp. TRM 82003]
MTTKRNALLVGDTGDNAPWHPLEPARAEMENIISTAFDIEATDDYDRFATLDRGRTSLCISYTDCWNGAATAEQTAGLLAYVAGGGGLLVVHNGISLQSKYELLQMIGGKFTEHPPYQTLRYVRSAEHPMLDGVEDFTLDEEPYFYELAPHTPRNVFLEYEFEGRRYPAAWEHRFGLGRVVYLQPGHHAPSFQPPAYRRLLLNAARWAAGENE